MHEIADHIIPAVGLQLVNEHIRPGAAVHIVIAGSSIEDVVPSFAKEPVIPGIAIYRVAIIAC